jgi:hypothetical protein
MRVCALLCLGLLAGCQKSAAGVAPAAEATPPAFTATPVKGAPMGEEDGDDEKPNMGKQGTGAKKWRDTGVYVDGKPRGMLNFGEMPIGVQPTWVEEKTSIEIEPGHKGPTYTITKHRHYSFYNYLKAIGVDPIKVKEMHVYGPKFSETIVVTGAQIKKHAKDFLFRFGSEVGGKAIPVVPMGLKVRTPDKISSVMVYIEKKPPVLEYNVGLVLDGKVITNVPYYGDPMRGGVRVYQDDQLVFNIKRPLLRETEPAGKNADGTPYYSLLKVLEAHGVDGSKIAEAWVIRHERREEKLSRDELAKLTFVMGKKEKSEILIGDKQVLAQVIAVHEKPVPPEKLPKVLPEEIE